MAKVIMIQGTMSNAGKSFLAAGLCRIFKEDGFRPAPFKSQNMALNSFITKEGLEMGRAQVMQAEAAGAEPEVAMNPILLKPTSNMGSQLIVNGVVRGNYPAAEYFKMKKSLIPEIKKAYETLAAKYDVIVIEGAGSPAEINLRENDIVNMGLAELLDAPVLLAGDIDRGGVFAQLYGTAALLSEAERARIKAFIINKFRGDKEILKPGLAMLYDTDPTHIKEQQEKAVAEADKLIANKILDVIRTMLCKDREVQSFEYTEARKAYFTEQMICEILIALEQAAMSFDMEYDDRQKAMSTELSKAARKEWYLRHKDKGVEP